MRNSSSSPLYSVISSDIRDKIIRKELTFDNILPSENELCAKYHTTRRTVREALKQLEQDGLIYSKPKRGYFVMRPALSSFTIDNAQLTRDSTSQVKELKIVPIGDDIRDMLQLGPQKIAIEITRLNFCNDQLYGIEIKYLPYNRGYPSIENEISYAVYPDPADEKTYAFHYHAQISIRAALPPENVAALLGCDTKTPLLQINRLYVTQDGKPIGYSRQYLMEPYGELRGTSGYVQNKLEAVHGKKI